MMSPQLNNYIQEVNAVNQLTRMVTSCLEMQPGENNDVSVNSKWKPHFDAVEFSNFVKDCSDLVMVEVTCDGDGKSKLSDPIEKDKLGSLVFSPNRVFTAVPNELYAVTTRESNRKAFKVTIAGTADRMALIVVKSYFFKKMGLA